MGAHSFGGASTSNSGYSGKWTGSQNKGLSEVYYSNMISSSITFSNVVSSSFWFTVSHLSGSYKHGQIPASFSITFVFFTIQEQMQFQLKLYKSKIHTYHPWVSNPGLQDGT